MLHIRVICQGKLKEPFYKDAMAEYAKRLGGFCRFEVTELPEGCPPAELLAAAPKGAYGIALCIEGILLSSEALAERIAALPHAGVSALAFFIGGSDGLPAAVKEAAALRLSMSPMTFPHHLARVMLTEQLYRAFQINAGAKYHK